MKQTTPAADILDSDATIAPAEIHHVFFKTGRLGEMRDFYKAVLGGQVNFDNGWIAFTSFDDANHRIALFDRPGPSTVRKAPAATRKILSATARRRLTDRRFIARALRTFVRNLTGRGLDHVAYEYTELDHLLQTYRRLKAQGIEPYWTVNHGPTISFYYADPDGNGLELQWGVFGTDLDEVGRFLGESFTANPVGVDFDPEQLVAARLAGVPPREIADRSYAREPLTRPGQEIQ